MKRIGSARTTALSIMSLALLMLVSGVLHAATSITSWVAVPSTVAAGQAVVIQWGARTDAQQALAGQASIIVSLAGVVLHRFDDQDFLNNEDLAQGQVFSGVYNLPSVAYSTPGVYTVQVDILGTEDGVGFKDSATTTYTVTASVPTTVSPTSLSLQGQAGETVSGNFSVVNGSGPFTLSAQFGNLDKSTANAGESIVYSHPIAANATPGGRLADTITITPASGSPVTIPVSIEVTAPAPVTVTVQPTSLSLQGAAGDSPSADFSILTGTGPFTLSAQNGSLSKSSADLNESITYTHPISDNAVPGSQLSDSITVTPASGDPVTIPVSILVNAPTQPPVTVQPSNLSLEGAAGDSPSTSFSILTGNGPFTLSAQNGTLSKTSVGLGESVDYTHPIASGANPGSQLTDTITVTPASGDPVTITVNIQVTTPAAPPIVVQPTSLSLNGGAGDTPTASFTLTSGTPPFTLSSANPENRGVFSNNNPGLNETVSYGFRIPSDATDAQQFTDTITITDSSGASTTLQATITAEVSGGGIGQEEIDEAMQSIARTAPQRAVAAAISSICPAGVAQPRLQQDCNVMVGGALQPEGSPEKAQSSQALGQVTTDDVSMSVDASQTSLLNQGRNLRMRIAGLQGAATRYSARGLTVSVDGQPLPVGDIADELIAGLIGSRGGGAGADDADSALDLGPWGFFVNGTLSSGERDRTENVAGFDFDTISLTLGGDYRFRKNLVAGAAVGYTKIDTDLSQNGGNLDTEGFSLSLYGTYYRDSGLYLDGIFTYGWSDYDQRRNIRYDIGAVSVDQAALADFDGNQWSAAFGGGYSFSSGALSFGPTAHLEYLNTDVDGFEERMTNPDAAGGGWATRIEGQELESFTLQLGGELSYAVSTSWGVLLPNIHLEWVHEFEEGSQNVVGHFVQDTSRTLFSLPTDSLDQDYFNLRLGLSAQFAQGRSAYLAYRKLFGYDNLDAYSISAGIRLEF